MEKERFVPLTYIMGRTANIKYVTLIDSGANCSCITEGLVEALNLKKSIRYKKCLAKAWNDEKSEFLRKIIMNIEVGRINFIQNSM